MSRLKPTKRYYVTETKIGSKRQRRCHGSNGTKAEAQSFQKPMRKMYGDKYTYKLRWEWV